MFPKEQSADSWRAALQFINRCPVCSQPYASEAVRLFAKKNQASLVHLSCQSCQSFFVAMIVVLGQGLSSVGMVTDLSFTDLKRLQRATPITADELIDGYQLLERPDFSFDLLLK